MKSNAFQRVETEGVVFLSDQQYSPTHRKQFVDAFQAMITEGKLSGEFNDMKWMGFSGIKHFRIDFEMDPSAYKSHVGKEFHIPYNTMQDMLRCYAIFICGTYIFPTINSKINGIKEFLTRYGDHRFSLTDALAQEVQEFLCFIGTPENVIDDMMQRVRKAKASNSNSRELSHMINYIAIAHEVKSLYQSPLADELFIKWFPILFWTQITFVIPLRATEMLVTPFECISRRDGKVYLSLRRTKLKKGKRRVYYCVEDDYKDFTYEIPDNWMVEQIEKYQALTANHERRYLFDHTKYMVNSMVSLQSFNILLAGFVDEYLIGNSKYDYARYAADITEFEHVTAGDSRPIAMAALYYQGINADVIRQLADHTQMSTSYGYFTNISNTIKCTSIIRVQERIERERKQCKTYELAPSYLRQDSNGSYCTSPRQPLITGDITDCEAEKHLQECIGCRYYYPSKDEIDAAMEKRKQELDDAAKRLLECAIELRDSTKDISNFEKVFLDAHSGAVRFRSSSDEFAKEAAYRWVRSKNTPKKSF